MQYSELKDRYPEVVVSIQTTFTLNLLKALKLHTDETEKKQWDKASFDISLQLYIIASIATSGLLMASWYNNMIRIYIFGLINLFL